MQITFCVPPSDDNGGWDFTHAKYVSSIEISNIEEYVRFIDFMKDKTISIFDDVSGEDKKYNVVDYEYHVESSTHFLYVYITPSWD